MRAPLVADLPADLVELYEKIRESTGMGAALLRGGRCEGCRLELSGSERSRVDVGRARRGRALRGVPADPRTYSRVRLVSRPRRLKVIVEADGGARGNPGPAGYGAVVREASTGEVLLERARAIGVATNNVAEYSGLIAGLQAAADLGAVDVEVRMDSKLVVEQMSGRWQIKHPGLRPLAAQAAALVRRFDTVRFTWIPRERNKRADALANAAMDGKAPPEVDLSPSTESQAESSIEPSESKPFGGAQSWMPPTAGLGTRLVLVRHGETELHRAAALLRSGRRRAVADRAAPGGADRLASGHNGRSRRPWSRRRCRGVWRPPRRSPERLGRCPYVRNRT